MATQHVSSDVVELYKEMNDLRLRIVLENKDIPESVREKIRYVTDELERIMGMRKQWEDKDNKSHNGNGKAKSSDKDKKEVDLNLNF